MNYEIGQQDERAWGNWEVLDLGSGYAVKRIVVHPGRRLSLQRHQFRSENWLIAAGTAEVTRNDGRFSVQEGDTVTIAPGDIHRIQNIGPGLLVVIEVQRGEQLDEHDIERLEDDYGRLPLTPRTLHSAA
jgi:mannose-6-phosphate isomerase-like protein (cupin superfamily)